MSGKIDQDLLKRFFNKECSAEEAKEVYQWLQNPENQEEVSLVMAQRWEEVLGNAEEPKLQAHQPEVLSEHSSNPRVRRLASIMRVSASFSFFRLAAVISLLCLIAATGYFFFFFETPTEPQQAVQPVWLQKETQKGQRLTFKLSDGTTVTLNTESKLHYPQRFDSLSRNVRLEGEAYFEVAKDQSRPFQVISDSIITTALGTIFNIYSPDSTRQVIVTLLEGKVGIDRTGQASSQEHQHILLPGESAVYDKDIQNIEKQELDMTELLAWKNGLLILKDASISEIKIRLESWYGVEIQLNNQPESDWTYTGDFRNESLENVLKGISFSKEIEYSIQGKNVEITFK